MKRERVIIMVGLMSTAYGGCAAPGSAPAVAPTSVQTPSPARAIHLRATFDADPTVYIGRFVPEGLSPEEIDENTATVTRCSRFVKARVVDVRQEVDEIMYASRSAGVALGLAQAVPLGLSAGRNSTNSVRVQYTIARKIQSDIDADGLVTCCRDDPSQCTGKVIGEFLMGSGSVLRSRSAQEQLGASAQPPQGPRLGVTSDADDQWRIATTFKDVYFAFVTSATPAALPAAARSQGGATPPSVGSDCSWCDDIPRSLDGKYFCGVSSDAVTEAKARELAMRDAREQAVRYLGESIATASTYRSTEGHDLVDNEQTVRVAAQGVASRVKDEKWCRAERIPTPAGERYASKVLAFVSKFDLEAAAAQARARNSAPDPSNTASRATSDVKNHDKDAPANPR